MVVDTMVFAYALLNVPEFRDEAVAVLGTLDEVFVPDSLHAELANVVWQWVSHTRVSLKDGLDVLADADQLVSRSYLTRGLWEEALVLAADAHHPVYDTLFVALANATGTRVITYDQKLLAAFPESTLTPLEFLSAD